MVVDQFLQVLQMLPERGQFDHYCGHKTGYLEEASGGTLFLDELNSMSLAMQSKILRVLQEKAFPPEGWGCPEGLPAGPAQSPPAAWGSRRLRWQRCVEGRHLLDLYNLDENVSTTMTALQTQAPVIDRVDSFRANGSQSPPSGAEIYWK